VVLLEYMEQQVGWSYHWKCTTAGLRLRACGAATVAPRRSQPAKAMCLVHSFASHPNRPISTNPQPLACPHSCTPQPPLLNRPGMGARLITYYRKKDGADTGHLELKKGALRVALSVWLRFSRGFAMLETLSQEGRG